MEEKGKPPFRSPGVKPWGERTKKEDVDRRMDMLSKLYGFEKPKEWKPNGNV